MQHLCSNPAPLQPLFRDALPPAPRAVRLAYWRYHFAPQRDDENSPWWQRDLLGMRPEMPCAVPAKP